jgi:glycerophosphoryl diester phosphodiesterase
VRAEDVKVIAHRGASDVAPEHTLAAYRRAIDDGADAVEADVRLTADGHLVCVHDRRVERTSNGRGVLSTLELADLQQLDFGSWKDGGAEAPDRIGVDNGERHGVLTLERLLQLVVDSSRTVGLAIETKHPTRYAGLVEQKLVDILGRFGLAGAPNDQRPSVHVMSFSELALRRMRRLAPQLPLVMLMERVPFHYRGGLLPAGFHIAGPSIEIIRRHPGFVGRLHEQDRPCFVWTVDEPDDVAAAVDAGVDAIITNRPAAVLAQLGRSPVGH